MKNPAAALSLAVVIGAAFTLAACGTNDSTSAPAKAGAANAPADQPAQPMAPQSATPVATPAGSLDQILAGAWRSDANKARDAYRHPKQTLDFFGVKPGDTLIEITPGGGWYTEVLAPLLKGAGNYVAAIPIDANAEGGSRGNDKFRAKLQENAKDFGDVKLAEFDPKAPVLGAPATADVVLTFRNAHNWVQADTAPAMFTSFFAVLKPGGTLGVVDHRAAAGADVDKIKESGYLPQDFVIKLATDAGFKLVDQSEINANAKDTKDYAKGVWTLPPTFAMKDEDREKYAAIGESDRMTLKFAKPAGDAIFHQGTDKK